jgi:hypothetical protein
MIIKVKVEDETWARMTTGKRVEGTIGHDKWTGENNFNAFNRKSREPGYERPKDETLYETASGWLKMSVKRLKIFVSANKGMGRERCAAEILMQAKELTDHLKHTKTIDEIMDEV